MLKIIVTGGAGFIGSNLVKALNERGLSNIIIVDHLDHDGKKKNISGLDYENFIEKESFFEFCKSGGLKNIEIIFHIGACTNTRELDEDYLLRNNTEYSKQLYNYCIERNARFIYASSGATYGDGSRGYSDFERNLKPLNGYGKSKYLFDEWVLDNKQKPHQWVGLKFFNVYGPNESHKGDMASVVFKGFNQIRKTEVLKLFKSYDKNYEDGGQKRDFIYVKDVVRVMLFFYDNAKKSGIFNVGTGKARSYLDLGRAIFTAMHIKPKIEFIDMPKDLIPQYQNFTQANISSLRGAGYKERFYELEEGVEEYIRSYLPAV